MVDFQNPFRPGAGHKPPHLAGRKEEREEFQRLLTQTTILENLVLTGLRGVGKTVLLDNELKPLAINAGWFWVGTDMSETTSISEENLALRLLTDLSVVTSSLTIASSEQVSLGFGSGSRHVQHRMEFRLLRAIYDSTPGLVQDKLKAVLEVAWQHLSKEKKRGVVFAYDEAQNLSDHAGKEQYPLSLLLDVFQSLQKRDIPFMLVLTGLPTLFPKLVEARTFSERMFRVLFLDRLSESESREAVTVPIQREKAVPFSKESVDKICEVSGGYPYFIQFICREVFDVFIQQIEAGEELAVPVNSIIRKLDGDFFAGRWARATDRQRQLLRAIASLPGSPQVFAVQDIVTASEELLEKGFSSSHASQMLASLCTNGLIYKNRHGKYSFAVPLLGEFILRQEA